MSDCTKAVDAGGVYVSIFESGVRGGRRPLGAQGVSGSVGSDGSRIGAAGIAARDPLRGPAAETALAFGRLFFPILLLTTIGAAALIYGNRPALWLSLRDVGDAPFDTGLVTLPLTFLFVQLTNRRYGAAYAAVQVLGATAAAIAAALYAGHELAAMRGEALPPTRLMFGFGAALFIAQMISILAFDRLRGPRWWQAPLFASLLGGMVLPLIAYPAVYAGTEIDWFGPMLSYMMAAIAMAFASLLPYWLLRSIIAPTSGFGGY